MTWLAPLIFKVVKGAFICACVSALGVLWIDILGIA